MENFAFIFARGGSKGLPGKNIKTLQGKPLIQYSIDTALETKAINRVFVSTDDDSIKDVAIECGATVIDRPAELATDESPEWLSWRHAVEWVTTRYGQFDNFISLPATSPLRSVYDVESAIKKRDYQNADICISVTPAKRSPYFNMVKINKNNEVELVSTSDSLISRRQDAPKVYDITTVVYVSTPDYVINHSSIFSGRVTCIEVPARRAIDIDDIYDFKLAEVILGGA